MDAPDKSLGDLVIQRTIFSDRLETSSLYYRRPGATNNDGRTISCRGRTSIVLPEGVRISTNSFFNSFFEAHWHRHTTVTRVGLRAQLSGQGTLRVWRVPIEGTPAVVGQVEFDGKLRTLEIPVPAANTHARELGMLYFEIFARSEVVLHGAEWIAVGGTPQPMKLVAGYCTCNRESFVSKNVQAIVNDRSLNDCVSAIVIVDQGTRKVRDYPGFLELCEREPERVKVFEQKNFGCSGGFARFMLEAMRLDDATHVLLMDDDAIVEPESIRRAAMFLSLAKEDVAVGGAMLDLISPTVCFDLGALVVPGKIAVRGVLPNVPLHNEKKLASLREMRYQHFNGWWFLAVPLAAVRRVGLPMPYFLKWDDVEYSCRMGRAGVPTVSLPGLGTWHMPFSMKKRGWTEYYEMRNGLACPALHFENVSRLSRALSFLRMTLVNLLRLDYYTAWQMCQGADDYCRGPAVLEEDPQPIQQKLLAMGRELSAGTTDKAACLASREPLRVPPTRLRRSPALVGALLRQFLRSSPAADAEPAYLLQQSEETWYALRKLDVVAIDDPYSEDHVVLRRNRARFVRLLGRALWTAAKLFATHGRVIRQWRARAPYLAGEPFWRRYLGVTLEDHLPPPSPHRVAPERELLGTHGAAHGEHLWAGSR